MKKYSSSLFLATLSFLFLINLTSQDSSIEGRRKQSVNFYGTLTTYQDRTLKVENISIARLYKQIPVYEIPAPQDLDPTKQLKEDPRQGIITRIDLSEIHEIQVPHPNKIYTFKKKKGYRKVEFIQITVISNDTKKTTNNYLIDIKRKLICDEVNEAGPIEKDIPWSAVKSLIIEGYKYRDMEKKEKKEVKNQNNKPQSYYDKHN